jgi:hypothetical protein
MKLALFVFFTTSLISIKSYSQYKSTKIRRNAIFLEAGGLGGYGSINYEKLILHKNLLMSTIRVGISTYHFVDFTNKFNPDIILPVTINVMYGEHHKIELGIGNTFSSVVRAGFPTMEPKRTLEFNSLLSIGYRFQKNTGGLIYRCAYTPILEFNDNIRHWLGISFGYSF